MGASSSPINFASTLPPLVLLVVYNIARVPLALPSSSFSVLRNTVGILVSAPSTSTPRVSSKDTIVSTALLQCAVLAFFTPGLASMQATSVRAFPPPVATDSFPSGLSYIPCPAFLGGYATRVAPLTSSPSGPGFLSILTPVIVDATSCFSFGSAVRWSLPVTFPRSALAPISGVT